MINGKLIVLSQYANRSETHPEREPFNFPSEKFGARNDSSAYKDIPILDYLCTKNGHKSSQLLPGIGR